VLPIDTQSRQLVALERAQSLQRSMGPHRPRPRRLRARIAFGYALVRVGLWVARESPPTPSRFRQLPA
jgi:hypothetical protein